MKNKIEFVGNDILKNGKLVGHLEGSRDSVYVLLFSDAEIERIAEGVLVDYPEAVARFKYRSPRRGAKKFIAWALQNFSNQQILEAIGWRHSDAKPPLVWARENGYGAENNS